MDFNYYIKPNQDQNPVWKISNFCRITDPLQTADFIYKENKFSILFLSLKFHLKYPLYIDGLIGEFVKSGDYEKNPNRVLIFLQDGVDSAKILQEITLKCISSNIKLMLTFSYEDVAKCLKAFKAKI